MKTNNVSVLMAMVVTIAFASTTASAATTITQAKANKGGVTPGDAPGFPITITRPGSYILAGNLTVDAFTTAIEIASDHVTLDLGGYAILGPVDCSGGLHPCAGAGPAGGYGVITDAVRFNITIRNGTIQGLGGSGVFLVGDSHLIEYVHARSNGLDGIIIVASADSAGSIAQFNTTQRNGHEGLYLTKGIARHNVADVNGTTGIVVITGSASNNVATRNFGWGLGLGTNVAYFDNMLDANGQANVAGGRNLGRNLCGATPCP